MPFVSGFLRIRRGGTPDNSLPDGERPTDPGYGIEEGHPDQGLPPGWGGGHVDNSLPKPPPGTWPPPTIQHPIQPAPPGTPPGSIWPPIYPPDLDYGRPEGGGGRPDNSLPGGGGRPDNSLPEGGTPDQGLPGGVERPDQGLPSGGGHPDQGLPSGGAHPDQSLPGSGARPDQGLPDKTFWVVVWIPGVGARYVCVDPEAEVPTPKRRRR